MSAPSDSVGFSLAEFLSALSFVTDTGMGQRMEHGLKTAYIGLALSEALGLSAPDQAAVYYGALVKDAGCTACGTVFASFFDGDDIGPRSDSLLLRPDSTKDAIGWFWRHASTDPMLPVRLGRLFSFMTHCRGVMKEGVTAHCEVGELFARRLRLPASVQEAVRYSWERWDGKGMGYGMRGPDVPVAARVLHFAQVIEAAHAFGGAEAARAIATERRGTDFDPELVTPFLDCSARAGFWDIPASDAAQEPVLAMKPACDFDRLELADMDAACEALADFADAKSQSTWNHSLSVAETAVAIGERMGLSSAELGRLRRAGLVHDIGKAAIPVGILEKPGDLTMEESECFQLHPYYTERALSRVGPLRDLALEAGSHHERLDGGGYFRQLAQDQIPLGGRILAVADRFSLESRAGTGADAASAIKVMKSLVGTELDPDCYEALLASEGLKPAGKRLRARTPGSLTDREIEVLRLVCLGRTNREIAQSLVLSGKTVEHHLEHVYNKLGVTSRTAAGVYAVQNGLAP